MPDEPASVARLLAFSTPHSAAVLASLLPLMPTGKLQIIPLGGLGEFGMNCMAVRWGDDIIVIDAGLMFPEVEVVGVDIVVPDLSYLTETRQRVRGIILTHGHEDHIGALPWILSELNVPVWGTEFTLAYVEDKLDEHGLLNDADLREIRPNERFKAGAFTIHPIQGTPSLVDFVARAIHTPLRGVLHPGDLQVHPTPTDNRPFAPNSLAEHVGGDRRRPWLYSGSGRTGDSARRDEKLSAGKSLCVDQRNAGRSDVGAVARGG